MEIYVFTFFLACYVQEICKFWRYNMKKYLYIVILVGSILSGCTNQYTGLGFPYSNEDKKARIEKIELNS